MEKKRISVLVAGQRFNLITDEEEKYVIDIASKIDAKITSISISQNMSRERAAVLAALDLADDGEQNKRELNEIKEQIKDYLSQIEKLKEENAGLKAELSKAKLEVGALDDARKTVASKEREGEALKAQIFSLKEQIELMRGELEKAAERQVVIESAPVEKPDIIKEAEATLIEDEPVPQEAEEEPVFEEEEEKPAKKVTAEDDLFFEPPAEEPVKPQPRKEKKNRHEHNHDNPYRSRFMNNQKPQKGYTQQRQYSLFDDTDE